MKLHFIVDLDEKVRLAPKIGEDWMKTCLRVNKANMAHFG